MSTGWDALCEAGESRADNAEKWFMALSTLYGTCLPLSTHPPPPTQGLANFISEIANVLLNRNGSHYSQFCIANLRGRGLQTGLFSPFFLPSPYTYTYTYTYKYTYSKKSKASPHKEIYPCFPGFKFNASGESPLHLMSCIICPKDGK